MARIRTSFVCRECGARYAKWQGRCPRCEEWDSLVGDEEPSSGAHVRQAIGEQSGPVPIAEVDDDQHERLSTGIGELDLLVGGGLVAGSVTLIGGDPGIGKSTLALQVLGSLADRGVSCLYATSEESPRQLKMRSARLGLAGEELLVYSETDADKIAAAAEKARPAVAVVDSVQMIYASELPGAPGSISQVRECAAKLVHLAKRTGMRLILIGHVTKSGAIAGPKVLEHIVDTVLYFEGDKYHSYRMLRSFKNRFGSTNEIAVFEMSSAGLVEVQNPSRAFLDEASIGRPGTAITCAMEGTRPLLVEVQALAASGSYGTPTRRVTGMDTNRVSMLIAVLEKRAGLAMSGSDVFANVVGGVRIQEPACDLALCLAVAGSFLDKRLTENVIVLGEVGLSGEVRPVPRLTERLKEAAKLGFTGAVVPSAAPQAAQNGLKITRVGEIAEALALLK